MIKVLQGDCREILATLPDCSVDCCVTSPPYWGLRDYGCAGQIGLEPTPELYVWHTVLIFREVRRVLREDGTLWLNLGDSYANDGKRGGSTGGKHVAALHGATNCGRRKERGQTGLKPKDLVGIPWRVAFALQADGWYLRQDIIWSKPNPMPESVRDRCTKSHEYIFLLAKSARYYYDAEAIADPVADPTRKNYSRGADSKVDDDCKTFMRTRSGLKKQKTHAVDCAIALNARHACSCGANGFTSRNKRSVWTVATQPYKAAHFATFPPKLIAPCIRAGCRAGGVVLDPFGGSGTTGEVAASEGRRAILIELNPAYVKLAENRGGLFCTSNDQAQLQGGSAADAL
jgi:DNA modification methylase